MIPLGEPIGWVARDGKDDLNAFDVRIAILASCVGDFSDQAKRLALQLHAAERMDLHHKNTGRVMRGVWLKPVARDNSSTVSELARPA